MQLIKIKHYKEVQAVISNKTINSLNYWTLKLHISSYTVYAISTWRNIFKFNLSFLLFLHFPLLILVSEAMLTAHPVCNLSSVFSLPELQDQNFRSTSLLCVEVEDIHLNRECYWLFGLQLKTITKFLHWTQISDLKLFPQKNVLNSIYKNQMNSNRMWKNTWITFKSTCAKSTQLLS